MDIGDKASSQLLCKVTGLMEIKSQPPSTTKSLWSLLSFPGNPILHLLQPPPTRKQWPSPLSPSAVPSVSPLTPSHDLNAAPRLRPEPRTSPRHPTLPCLSPHLPPTPAPSTHSSEASSPPRALRQEERGAPLTGAASGWEGWGRLEDQEPGSKKGLFSPESPVFCLFFLSCIF